MGYRYDDSIYFDHDRYMDYLDAVKNSNENILAIPVEKFNESLKERFLSEQFLDDVYKLMTDDGMTIGEVCKHTGKSVDVVSLAVSEMIRKKHVCIFRGRRTLLDRRDESVF